MIKIRNYNLSDYPSIESLYRERSTFGGHFDEARDSASRLDSLVKIKPDSILVAEEDGLILGTVTLFEDTRAAWLYRFAVQKEKEFEVSQLLWNSIKDVARQRGHTQVIVYAPVGDEGFRDRYIKLGFNKGDDYTAYWRDLK